MIKTVLPLQGAQVRSPFREIRSHKPGARLKKDIFKNFLKTM